MACFPASKGEYNPEVEDLRPPGPPGLVIYTWLSTKSPWEFNKNSFLSPILGVLRQKSLWVRLIVCFYKSQVTLMGPPLLIISELDFTLIEGAG